MMMRECGERGTMKREERERDSVHYIAKNDPSQQIDWLLFGICFIEEEL